MHTPSLIIVVVLGTILITSLIKRLLLWAAWWEDEGKPDWVSDISGMAWRICDFLNIDNPIPEPAIRDDMDRYEREPQPRDGYITRIVVPDEHAREQVVRALRYLHDQMIDTEYMAVNHLVHLYTDDDGEPTETPVEIVVEAPVRRANTGPDPRNFWMVCTPGGWGIKREGTSKVLRTIRDEDEAWALTKDYAKDAEGIAYKQGLDGRLKDTQSYNEVAE